MAIDELGENYTENKLNEITKELKNRFGNSIKNYDNIIKELKNYLTMNSKEKYKESLRNELERLNKLRIETTSPRGATDQTVNGNLDKISPFKRMEIFNDVLNTPTAINGSLTETPI